MLLFPINQGLGKGGKTSGAMLHHTLGTDLYGAGRRHTQRSKTMRSGLRVMCFLAGTLAFGLYGWTQSSTNPTSADAQKTTSQVKKKTAPGKEIGKGGEAIGKGVAKGTGNLAKGTAGSVGNLARGNVGGAGASLGKGVGGMGKNVAVSTGKGAFKIGKGLGGEFKKLGKRSKQEDEKDPGHRA